MKIVAIVQKNIDTDFIVSNPFYLVYACFSLSISANLHSILALFGSETLLVLGQAEKY